MKQMKTLIKILIGICALLVAFWIFISAQRTENLETASLKKWPAASMERRAAAVKILTGSDTGTDIIVKCVDKIATLPDAGEMSVRDATSICYTGMQLNEHL